MTDFANLPLRDSQGELQAVIETPKGCGIKYCYDTALHVFGISKFLNAGLIFPCDFGFFPSTRAADGDPLDIMVVHDTGTFAGLVMKVRPIGVLAVEQSEKGTTLRNDRIVAVPTDAERMASVTELKELGADTLKQFEVFLRETDEWEAKEIEFLGWKSTKTAVKLIEKAAANHAKGGLAAK
jgi:inorganic pyrophosphatase